MIASIEATSTPIVSQSISRQPSHAMLDRRPSVHRGLVTSLALEEMVVQEPP
jgi:hypothetical protein